MSQLHNPGVIRAVYAIVILLLILGASAFAYNMPWTFEGRIIFILGVTVFLFFIYIVRLLFTPAYSADVDPTEQFINSRELFSEIYENSPVPYVRTAKTGSMIDVNVAAVRLFGETKEELIGKSLYDSLRGNGETDDHIARIPQLVSAGTFINDTEGQLKRKDGEMRWVMISAFPYANKQETLVTLVDITKQKNIDTAKSEFVSLASHQLRTPISSIKWNMELLASPLIGSLNDKQKMYVDKVNRSAVRMGLLINDFLDASQLEMGTFEGKPESFELNAFINEQLEEFVARVMSKQLLIERAFTPETLNITADSHLLRMIVTNLLSNAIKYTPPQGTVSVGYDVVNDLVNIYVSDTGMGIPDADQEKLFGKFFRASNTKDSLIEGTGIGLYIVQQAVRKLNGTLAFGSKEGVGTKFVVSIPIAG